MSHPSPILIDIGAVTDACCVDGALEVLHKALSEPPSFDIWSPHHSPFIMALIERFTAFGLTQNQTIVDELNAWIAGERAELGPASPKPAGWSLTSQELSLARLYLAHLPLEHWSLWDYELLVEYLLGRYLPPDALRNEAEKTAVQSTIMGKVQALQPAMAAEAAGAVLAAIPTSVASAKAVFKIKPTEAAIMDYGALHCAEAVQGASDSFRHALKTIIIEHKAQELFGAKPEQALASKLFDRLGEANRDWRRIALTEIGEMANQGLIASLAAGEHVKRLEAYHGACPFCRKLDGRVFEVVAADAAKKDGDTQVWPGKTNQGRSASPMKRGEHGLVERTKDELWWPAAGVQHPHCRGSWLREEPPAKNADPDFAAWLEQHLSQGRPA